MKRVALGVLVLAAFAFALARLRRVERPRFEPEATYAAGQIVVGRVVIARRGESGRMLGRAVLCGRREVLSQLGTAPLDVHPTRTGDLEVRTSDGRAVQIVASSCAVLANRR